MMFVLVLFLPFFSFFLLFFLSFLFSSFLLLLLLLLLLSFRSIFVCILFFFFFYCLLFLFCFCCDQMCCTFFDTCDVSRRSNRHQWRTTRTPTSWPLTLTCASTTRRCWTWSTSATKICAWGLPAEEHILWARRSTPSCGTRSLSTLKVLTCVVFAPYEKHIDLGIQSCSSCRPAVLRGKNLNVG